MLKTLNGLFLSFALLPCSVLAQMPDTTVAGRYHQYAEKFLSDGNYDSASFYLEQSVEIFKYHQAWEFYADAAESYATSLFYQGKYDASEQTLLAALDTCDKYYGEINHSSGELASSLSAVYIAFGDCEKAYPLAQRSLKIIKELVPGDSKELGNAYTNLAGCAEVIEGYPEVRDYFARALEIFINVFGEEHEKVALGYSNLGWACGKLGDSERQMDYYRKSLDIRSRIHGEDHPRLIVSLINLSSGYFRLGNYKEMLRYSRRAIDIIEAQGEDHHPQLSSAYLSLANYYSQIGDYSTAISYYHKIMALDKANLGPEHPYHVTTYGNLGSCYIELNDLGQARNYYQMALSMAREKIGNKSMEVVECLEFLGKLFTLQGEYPKAIGILDETFSLLTEITDSDHPKSVKILLKKAEIYGEMGQYQKQLAAYLQALQISARHPRRFFNIRAELFLEMGNYYRDQGRADSAYYCYAQTYEMLNYAEDKEGNPVISRIIMPEILLKALIAEAELKRKEAVSGERDWSEVLKIYTTGAAIFDSTRQTYVSRESKQFLSSRAISVYEGGIEAAMNLYHQTGDKKYINCALKFAEKGKATLLYQNLQELNARSYASIPESTLEFERDLGSKLAFFQKSILGEEEKGAEKDQTKIDFWYSRIFDIRKQKDSLISRLEEDYPAYYQLKYNPGVADLDQIQAYVKENDSGAILEYFEGDRNIYLFFIDAESAEMLAVPNENTIQARISNLRDAICYPFLNKSLSREEQDCWDQTYRKEAAFLYELLVKPMEAKTGRMSGKMKIVPDGVLGYLPFDALLTGEVNQAGKYRTYPYLLNKYQISYGYSSSLWLRENRVKAGKNIKSLLAFSPGFGEGTMVSAGFRDDFTPLIYSRPEVEHIGSLLQGDIFLDEDATEGRFKEMAHEYRVIHISSHASVDDNHPLYSRIAFSAEDSLEDGFLEVAELFNLHLFADMVVLSACETGIGKLVRGEGITSLARGFSYAGAKSIVTSLWQVNDAATASIMENFYQNLSQDAEKDAALRQAKLAYLERADNLTAHPFYWSAFIPVGNMEPLSDGNPVTGQRFFLLLACLALIVFGSLRYLKSRKGTTLRY